MTQRSVGKVLWAVGMLGGEHMRYPLIRNAMKAIAPNALVAQSAIDGECLEQLIAPGVKCRVEAGNVRYLRHQPGGSRDRGEIVKLVQRGECG